MMSEVRLSHYVRAYVCSSRSERRGVIVRRVWGEFGGIGVIDFARAVGVSIDLLVHSADLAENFDKWARRMARPSHRRRPRNNGAHRAGYRQEVRVVARQATQGHQFARLVRRGGSHQTVADRRAWQAARTRQ